MNKDKLLNIIRSKDIVIPLYIYKLYDRLDLELNEFMFLMYLYNIDERISFNPQKFSDDFGISIQDVLLYVDKLSEKKLINIEVIKNDKNISEEFLSLVGFYDKISMLLIESTINDSDKNESLVIFERIEKEFGRVLSPMEYEIIKAWNENGISDELILEALKEAVFNGVNNLRYIDKILYEWQKKGIKTKEDVEKNKKEYKNKKEKVEVFDYNWLEDDE